MKWLFRLIFAALVLVALATPWLKPATSVDEAVSGRPLLPTIPHVDEKTEVPDFTQFNDVTEKKIAFFEFLLPTVRAENVRIDYQRQRIQWLDSQWQLGTTLSADDKRWLRQIARNYEVDFDLDPDSDMFVLLERRVDQVPESLVLIQAANESGWGTSRFALEGLNFFGQWCYRKGCGLVPLSRDDDGRHEVARFDSVNASVRSYMRNINTHPAYLDLRLIRQKLRQQGEDISAIKLTEGLHRYSERGAEYIDELNAMIRVNRPLIQQIN
ncbi:glucosaminidase domain-containing protein [Idiomarina xiamenensis]|uniref:Peptidoglycan hydrolase n=1 Tax=Idiomarina xiamenensis 10-D-4 TaxID=740709 RepID=K2KWW1_9GAMM|nr:glucosaminidase domain-containing protein [Idiomarina xiamenensis]EKE86989.1 peptidoglycan hydrolase [Idiomarina xiamenensis 10-D-4]